MALGLWILAAISCSIGGGGTPSVGKIGLATALDKDYKAVEATTTYTPTQTFYLSVQVSNLATGAKVKTVWYHGEDQIKEYTYTSDKAGSGYVGFTLKPKDSWPIGNYHAKVYLEDKLAQSVDFSVVPPKSAIASRVTRVTMAKGIDKDYNPIEPTIIFSPGDKVHAIIFGDLGLYSQLRAEWYLNGKLSKENVSTFTAEQNAQDTVVYFGLNPPLPTGAHQVKIYLDGNIERTLDFTVQEGAAAVPSPVPTKSAAESPAAGGVDILSHNSYTDHKGRLWVVGELQNNTGSNLSSLTVALHLLDANGNILDTGTISPNTSVIAVGDKIPVGVFWPGDKPILQKVDRYRITVEDFQTTDEPAPPSPWTVSGVKSETTSDGPIILSGQLTNQSNETLQEAEVWGAIYDAKGKILGGGMATMPFSKPIAPGEQASFKLTIAGPLPDADSYSVITMAPRRKQATKPSGDNGGRKVSPTAAVVQPTTAPLPAASPTPASPAPGGRTSYATYTHPTWNFSLQYPSTWKVDEQTSYVTLQTADELMGLVIAAISTKGANITPEQLLGFFIEGMKGQLPEITLQPGIHNTTLDGEPAVYQDASVVVDKQSGDGEFVATLHGSRGYMIFLFAATGHGNIPALRETLKTGFRWTGKSPTPTSVAPPTSSGPKGQLLYTVWHGPDSQNYSLYLINLAGGGATKLVDLASEPSWSPDGRQFVFYHWTDGLFIANADGSSTHKIVADTEAGYPAWSPRGDRIVYSSLLGGRKYNLFFVTNLKEVSQGQKLGPGNRPVWSPGGQYIAYDNCDTQGHCGVWVMNMDGSNPHPLTRDGGGQGSWSPNGRYIAYAAPQDGNYEIMVINADGSGRRQLTHNKGNDALPTWSGDGNYIFYRTDQNGTAWAIYRMRADGSDKRKVVDAQVNPERWQWERMDAK